MADFEQDIASNELPPACKTRTYPIIPAAEGAVSGFPTDDTLPTKPTTSDFADAQSSEERDHVRIYEGGYQELADHMAEYPADAIFRGFKSLHMLNLLYYQAELNDLETALQSSAKQDRESDDKHRQDYWRDYRKLRDRKTEPDTTNLNDDQQRTLVRIRQVLKEYDEAMRYAYLLCDDMPSPLDSSVQTLRRWMSRDHNNCLTGQDSNLWNNRPSSDLITLAQCDNTMGEWIRSTGIMWFHNLIGHRYKKLVPKGEPMGDGYVYGAEAICTSLSAIAIILSSLLPIGAVAILWTSYHRTTKLWLMTLFTLVFATCFHMHTDGKRHKVFIASTLFVALQVVLIVGFDSSSSC